MDFGTDGGDGRQPPATVLPGLPALAMIGQAMPDERHGGFGTGMLGMIGPLVAAIALRRAPRDLRWVTPVLALNASLVVATFAVMMGVGDLVTSRNVGIVQRVNSLTNMPWDGQVGFALLRWRQRGRLTR